MVDRKDYKETINIIKEYYKIDDLTKPVWRSLCIILKYDKLISWQGTQKSSFRIIPFMLQFEKGGFLDKAKDIHKYAKQLTEGIK